MEKGGCVYFMSNHGNTTIYVGVTSDLKSRVYDHKTHRFPRSFTARYKCHKLVYYEVYHSIEEAIAREKQIKAGSRQRKLDLINKMNQEWRDLSGDLE